MRQVGDCALCGAACFRVVGASLLPSAGARRIQLGLRSGKRMDRTLCATCQPTPRDLPRLHHENLDAWAGQCQTDASRAWLLTQRDDVPLVVLGTIAWKDVR